MPHTMYKGVFRLIAGLCVALCISASAVHAKPFDVTDASIQSIHHAMTRKKLTCEQLVNTYIQRIKHYNLDTSRGGAINAFVSINPLVIEQARQLDEQYRQKRKLTGPLHCVPVVVKDNIDTIDTPSTSGSLALLGSQPIQDAFLVQQLKQAGALIIGKGTMDELASGGIGISGRSGRTGNAYDPTQSPGGSSGGPAAAVSASFALVGIGTDNSGSIRIPASFNGLYGLRPSMGLVSQAGIFPRGNIDGIAGPMTRHLDDLAIVLSVIAKQNPHDKRTHHHPVVHDYATAMAERQSLQGLHIGVVNSVAGESIYTGTSTEHAKQQQQLIKRLQALGATMTRVDFPDFDIERENNTAGEVEQINQYLSAFPSTRQSMADICYSNRTLYHRRYCLSKMKETAKLNSRTYVNTLTMISKNQRYVETVMQDKGVQVLLAPIGAKGKADYDMHAINTWQLPLSSNSGLPALAVTIGMSNDEVPMPMGMQFIGRPFDETTLLQIAHVLSKHSPPIPLPHLRHVTPDPVLSTLSLTEWNHFLTVLGMNVFKEFFAKQPASKLTPAVFNDILLSTRRDFSP